MRMVTGITGAGNMDITWHYPVNLIWWYVFSLHAFPALPSPTRQSFSSASLDPSLMLCSAPSFFPPYPHD